MKYFWPFPFPCQHHVFSYKGQTVMLLELEAGDLYVVASDAEWKESTSRFGGMDAVILEAVPRRVTI